MEANENPSYLWKYTNKALDTEVSGLSSLWKTPPFLMSRLLYMFVPTAPNAFGQILPRTAEYNSFKDVVKRTKWANDRILALIDTDPRYTMTLYNVQPELKNIIARRGPTTLIQAMISTIWNSVLNATLTEIAERTRQHYIWQSKSELTTTGQSFYEPISVGVVGIAKNEDDAKLQISTALGALLKHKVVKFKLIWNGPIKKGLPNANTMRIFGFELKWLKWNEILFRKGGDALFQRLVELEENPTVFQKDIELLKKLQKIVKEVMFRMYFVFLQKRLNYKTIGVKGLYELQFVFKAISEESKKIGAPKKNEETEESKSEERKKAKAKAKARRESEELEAKADRESEARTAGMLTFNYYRHLSNRTDSHPWPLLQEHLRIATYRDEDTFNNALQEVNIDGRNEEILNNMPFYVIYEDIREDLKDIIRRAIERTKTKILTTTS